MHGDDIEAHGEAAMSRKALWPLPTGQPICDSEGSNSLAYAVVPAIYIDLYLFIRWLRILHCPCYVLQTQLLGIHVETLLPIP